MNDQLQSVLLGILQSAVDTAGQIKDLVVGETPLVVQQLLMWHSVKSGIQLIISLLVVVIGYKMFKHVCNSVPPEQKSNWAWAWEWRYKTHELELAGFFTAAMGVLMVVLFSISAVVDVLTVVQIFVAPKVYLIEYMSELTKGVD